MTDPGSVGQERKEQRMKRKDGKGIQGNEVRYFCFLSAALLLISAFLFASPAEIVWGMREIILSRDALVTDYMELAGFGAAFFNAGLVLLMAILLIEAVKLPYTGLTIAALFINTGFGFWGKNPINIIPIVLGTAIYARVHRSSLARYVYTALFATCLAPFVTEMVYILPFAWQINLLIAVSMGLFVGFILPPLSMHTASIHMGYSLFNVGFSGGTLAFVIFCILRSYGIESEAVFIWKEGRHPAILAGSLIYFAATFFYGCYLEQGKIEKAWRITRHPGRAVADFVLMDSAGATLMNMGIMGLLAELYILLVGGDLSGPILGCLLTVFGFSAFGAHPKNYLPILAGVFFSTFFSQYSVRTPGILIASLFAVGLSPIAGEFGALAGVAAGMLHASIVMCTSQLYGGLNLYNNGFSAGWVAIVMVPTVESFRKEYKYRKLRRDNRRKERAEKTEE